MKKYTITWNSGVGVRTVLVSCNSVEFGSHYVKVFADRNGDAVFPAVLVISNTAFVACMEEDD